MRIYIQQTISNTFDFPTENFNVASELARIELSKNYQIDDQIILSAEPSCDTAIRACKEMLKERKD